MTTYTVFQQAGGGTIADDSSTYTLGMAFTLSQPATLTGIWFYSAAGANGLPVGCAVYLNTGTGTGTIVAGSENDSPSWSAAAGSGWVRCAYPGGPSLSASVQYKVVVLKDATSQVYSATSHYWDSGPGSGGITNGILTAPNSGDGGQDSYVSPSASLTYPASSFNAANYWIDVEVSDGSPPPPAAGPAYAAFMSSM